MKGIFVTGTDTGVGKSLISAALARHYRDRGIPVGVLKPFSSGSREDAKLLKQASRSCMTLKQITPFYFKYPLAPMVSLALEKRNINPRILKSKIRPYLKPCPFCIVEGIGGALVPITKNYDSLDIPRQLEMPVLIVARLSLGTINHTLLTVKEVKNRRLKLAGIILNDIEGRKNGLAESTNPAVIQKLSGVPVLGVYPRIPGSKSHDFDYLAKMVQKHIELRTLL
jgi:dethiobiotin synthetase